VTDFSSYDEPVDLYHEEFEENERLAAQEPDPDAHRDDDLLPAQDALRQWAADEWDLRHWNEDGSIAEGYARCTRCGGPANVETRWILDKPILINACPICRHTENR